MIFLPLLAWEGIKGREKEILETYIYVIE